MVVNLPPPPSSAFASDNAAGAHPAVLEAIARANAGHRLAYGNDDLTRECSERFGELFGADVTTRLAFNGTGANVLALATMLGALPGPHHGVVCTEWAHIAVDEAGAPERALGAKLLHDAGARWPSWCPSNSRSLAHLQGVQHHAQPGVVSLSPRATELGTVYTAAEVAALCEAAHRLGMLVHLDEQHTSPTPLRRWVAQWPPCAASLSTPAVDVVSFGGTKAGLLGGEAVIFLNPQAEVGSKFVRKQVTQLPSKMRFSLRSSTQRSRTVSGSTSLPTPTPWRPNCTV